MKIYIQKKEYKHLKLCILLRVCVCGWVVDALTLAYAFYNLNGFSQFYRLLNRLKTFSILKWKKVEVKIY